jgi:hypothetical protein
MTLLPQDAPRWFACPASASPVAVELAREELTELALEMRAARWAADLLLYGDATSAEDLVGTGSTDGFEVTPQLAAHAAEYATMIAGFRPDQALRQVSNPYVDGPTEIDVATVGDRLIVATFAYGWKIVEPEDDERLMLAAVLNMDEQHQVAEFWVFQPRPHHDLGRWRVARLNRVDMARLSVQVAERIHDASRPNAPAIVNEHCGRCRLRSRCATLAAKVYADRDQVAGRGAGGPMTGAELGAELQFLEDAEAALKARRTGAFAEAEARSRAGEYIPGYFRKQLPGRRVVTAEAAAVKFMTGHDLHKRVEKSPAELEKEGVDPKIVDKISRRSPGGAVLARVTSAEIRRAFK